MNDDFLININDLRSVGMCAAGVRQWASSRGMTPIQFRKFLSEGMMASEMLAFNDGLVNRAVEALMERRDVHQ